MNGTKPTSIEEKSLSFDKPEKSGTRKRPPVFRALGQDEPPDQIVIDGQTYELEKILKHDSWAATAIYNRPGETIICKFNRRQPVFFIPMGWLGNLLAQRESAMYTRLADLANVPPLLGKVYVDGKWHSNAVAHVYVPGHTLGLHEKVNNHFFPKLQELLAEIHKRDIAYVDLHKRENILVGDDGEPYLFDFQISFYLPKRLGAFAIFRKLLHLLQQSDDYHVYKHFARVRPDQCGFTLDEVSKLRPWWIRVHRIIGVPLRNLRRRLLVLLGIRSGLGQVTSEQFLEEGLRSEQDRSSKTAA